MYICTSIFIIQYLQHTEATVSALYNPSDLFITKVYHSINMYAQAKTTRQYFFSDPCADPETFYSIRGKIVFNRENPRHIFGNITIQFKEIVRPIFQRGPDPQISEIFRRSAVEVYRFHPVVKLVSNQRFKIIKC